jgi:hypothetical protein
MGRSPIQEILNDSPLHNDFLKRTSQTVYSVRTEEENNLNRK